MVSTPKTEQDDLALDALKSENQRSSWLLILLSLALVVIVGFGTHQHKISSRKIVAAVKERVTSSKIVAVTVVKHDSLSKIFKRLKLHTSDIRKILAYKDARLIYNIRPGQHIIFALDRSTLDWRSFRYPLNIQKTLVVDKDYNGISAHIETAIPNVHLEYLAANLDGKTLLDSIKKVGISTRLTHQLMYIFSDQVNFRARTYAGDSFAFLYKVETINGKRLPNRIVAADFTAHGKHFKAVRFTDEHGRSRYYDMHGLAMHTSFWRVPVHYTRVSSRFSLRRYEPILHIYRPHLGVDFAGISGTPVKATCDGKIIYMHLDGGYGNLVVIKHNRKYSTAYAHLRGFNHHFHVGSHILRGQVLGYLGSTGLSTGPHVHYEFRINGVRHDPLRVKLPRITWVAADERSKFLAEKHTLFAKLESYSRLKFAANM